MNSGSYGVMDANDNRSSAARVLQNQFNIGQAPEDDILTPSPKNKNSSNASVIGNIPTNRQANPNFNRSVQASRTNDSTFED